MPLSIPPVIEQLSLGALKTLTANTIYAIPSVAIQLTWQDPSGSTLQGSVDGITFGSLGTSGAAEVKTVWTSVGFIKTTSSTTVVLAKSGSIASVVGGASGGGAGTGSNFTVGGNLIVNGQGLFADGSAPAPSISFKNSSDTGLYLLAPGYTAFSANVVPTMAVGGPGIILPANKYVNWTNGASLAGAIDLYIGRDAAGALALQDSANPQTFRIYNTYTNASNYERLFVGWNAGNCYIVTQGIGTGIPRNLIFGTGTGANITFTTNSANWQINSNGHLLCSTDNTFDIGASGTNRPRNIFIAGNLTCNAINSGAALSSAQSVAPPASGSTTCGLFISSSNVGYFVGTGAPTFTAQKGSIYVNTTASTAATRLYINTDGGTTWTAITTVA